MLFPIKGSRGNQIVVQVFPRTNGGGQGLALLLVCYVCVSHGAGGGVNLSMWEGGGREPLLTAAQLKLRRDQWAEHGGAYSAADAEVAAAAVDYGLKQAEKGNGDDDSYRRDIMRYRAKGCHMIKAGCSSYLVELIHNMSTQHGVELPLPTSSAEALGDLCPGGQCGSCAVVGNAWHLLGSGLGASIDAHDLVLRFAGAIEHEGFDDDVGSKSDIRLVYHSTAPLTPISYAEKVLHLITRVPEDVRSFMRLASEWPASLLDLNPKLTDKELASSVLLMSPWFVDQVRNTLGLDEGNMLFGERAWPSAGLMALAWARHHCSSIHTYGFGGGQPEGAWHYWEAPESASHRLKDHKWSAEQQVRKYLSGLGFLKEHFMAPHVTSENVDQVMAPLYHKLVEEESMLPPEQRRILPPQSWDLSNDLRAFFVYPAPGWCFEEGRPSYLTVALVSASRSGACGVQVCSRWGHNPHLGNQQGFLIVTIRNTLTQAQEVVSNMTAESLHATGTIRVDTTWSPAGHFVASVLFLGIRGGGGVGENALAHSVHYRVMAGKGSCEKHEDNDKTWEGQTGGAEGDKDFRDSFKSYSREEHTEHTSTTSEQVQKRLMSLQRPKFCKREPLLKVRCPLTDIKGSTVNSFLGAGWAGRGSHGTLAGMLSLAFHYSLPLILFEECHEASETRTEWAGWRNTLDGALGSWRVGSGCSHLDSRVEYTFADLGDDTVKDIAAVAQTVPSQYKTKGLDFEWWRSELTKFVETQHAQRADWRGSLGGGLRAGLVGQGLRFNEQNDTSSGGGGTKRETGAQHLAATSSTRLQPCLYTSSIFVLIGRRVRKFENGIAYDGIVHSFIPEACGFKVVYDDGSEDMCLQADLQDFFPEENIYVLPEDCHGPKAFA